jgi:hypothetical protein
MVTIRVPDVICSSVALHVVGTHVKKFQSPPWFAEARLQIVKCLLYRVLTRGKGSVQRKRQTFLPIKSSKSTLQVYLIPVVAKPTTKT